MVNLYIPYTPYHILNSFAIAASRPEEENYLIFAGSNRESLDLMLKVFPSVGIKIFPLQQTDNMSNIGKFMVKRRNIRMVRDLFAKLPEVDNVFFFCGYRVVTSFAAHLAIRRNRNTKFFLVEDGVETYVSAQHSRKKWYEKTVDRLFYGNWHKDAGGQGDFMNFEGVYALFPEKLLAMFDDKMKYAVPREHIFSLFSRDAFSAVVPVSEKGSREITTLVAIDRAGYTESKPYRKMIAAYIGNAESNAELAALKLHPSDRRRIEFLGKNKTAVSVLPSRLPIELFYLLYQDTLRFVVGGLTSSLLTAKWLLPHIDVVSIFPEDLVATRSHAQEILRLFQDCGIHVRRF